MNRTLTREQIEELKGALIEGDNTKDFALLFEMALNSMPLKFDPKDETTWPEKHGLKCIIYRISPHILEAAEWRVGKWEHEKTGWFVDCRKTKDKLVTHYIPIPEVET